MSSQFSALGEQRIQTQGESLRASQKKRGSRRRENRVVERRFDSQPESHAEREHQREQPAQECGYPGAEAHNEGDPESDLANRGNPSKVKEYDYAAIALYDPAIRKLRVRTLPSQASGELIQEERLLPVENSPAGWAFKARRPLILNHIREEGKPVKISETLVRQGIQSACRIPLVAHDHVLGTLTRSATARSRCAQTP
jgi:GAF domain-containing protein